MKELGIVDLKVYEFLAFKKVAKPRDVSFLVKRSANVVEQENGQPSEATIGKMKKTNDGGSIRVVQRRKTLFKPNMKHPKGHTGFLIFGNTYE